MRAETTTMPTQKPNLQHWLAVIFMLICTLFAWWLTPQEKWFEHVGQPQFEQIIPPSFADWAQVPDGSNTLIVNPQQQEALDDLYTQIVSRTYVQQSTGRRLMLSLAYGDNQTFSKQLHRPESCYSSQGFKIQALHAEQILANGHKIELQRMTAQVSDRQEQVSYFIRIGDRVVSGPPTNINLARMHMGLKGYIADGLLFRVSEISDDDNSSQQLHDQFINDLLKTLSPAQQAMLIGQN
jgi:EpsI family protein